MLYVVRQSGKTQRSLIFVRWFLVWHLLFNECRRVPLHLNLRQQVGACFYFFAVHFYRAVPVAPSRKQPLIFVFGHELVTYLWEQGGNAYYAVVEWVPPTLLGSILTRTVPQGCWSIFPKFPLFLREDTESSKTSLIKTAKEITFRSNLTVFQSAQWVRLLRVCVLHDEPLFLPVHMENNQCPCRFSNPRRDTDSVVTKLRHRDTSLPRM